ncbi:MAG: dihydrofolate reductase [Patescibacteria group bacterium]
MINIIVALGKNREIGFKNQLLWDIPEDMKRFKKITTGHIVIMGSKTYESIGKPLPNRINIVIAKEKDYQATGCIVAHSIIEAVEKAKGHSRKKEIFIIGGGSIYKQFLPLTDKLYLTLVDDAPEADIYFPDYFEFKNIIKEETHETDNLKYTFLELTK